jgi:membrane protease YdiL (CAAX protease family)
MERILRNHRYLLPVNGAILCTFIYVLMRRYSLPARVLGLHLHGLPIWLGLGVGIGVAYLTLTHPWAMRRVAGTSYEGPEYLARGSAGLWVLINLVACFAEELWRAFCLVSLARLNHRAVFAVAITSLAFALAHYGGQRSSSFEIGNLLGYATSGVLFAVVFLWSGSIVATYTGHLLTNLVVLYRVRRAKRTEEREGEVADGFAISKEPSSEGSPTGNFSRPAWRLDDGAEGNGGQRVGRPWTLPCPACRREIARADVRSKGSFPCPYCGTPLETDKSLAIPVELASLLLAGSISYLAGATGLMLALGTAFLGILICFVFFAVHAFFWLKLVVFAGSPPPATTIPRDLLHFRITGHRDPPKSG